MKYRICILRSNPVKPDSRVEKEAWSLCRAGYKVHILAWDRDTNHKEKRGIITVAGIDIPITWLGYKAAYGEGIKSLKPFLQFQIHMRRWLMKHRNEFDVIHACDFDTAFFSQKIKNKKYIFDIFDFLYGEPKSLFQKVIRMSQIHIINNADATIICTEERVEQIRGSTPKYLAVIHNTPSIMQINEKDIIEIKSKSDKIKIAYIGILANERLLTQIGKVITRHKEVELHIAGFGSLDSFFEEMSMQYDNIYYYGRISYSQALDLEKKCDLMTAIYDPSDENCRHAAPNKFYESLMLGKPVFMAYGTGMSNIVEENDIGQLVEFSEDGFEKGLKQLIEKKMEWPRMSEKMQCIYHDYYSWEKMSLRLLELYNRI